MLIGSLQDPPQGPNFKPLSGDLFPKSYPPTQDEKRGMGSYFYRKYYISQRLFFSFAKKANYCNHEIMTNALQTNLIDLSKAQIVKLETSNYSQNDFEQFMKDQDQ